MEGKLDEAFRRGEGREDVRGREEERERAASGVPASAPCIQSRPRVSSLPLRPACPPASRRGWLPGVTGRRGGERSERRGVYILPPRHRLAVTLCRRLQPLGTAAISWLRSRLPPLLPGPLSGFCHLLLSPAPGSLRCLLRVSAPCARLCKSSPFETLSYLFGDPDCLGP